MNALPCLTLLYSLYSYIFPEFLVALASMLPKSEGHVSGEFDSIVLWSLGVTANNVICLCRLVLVSNNLSHCGGVCDVVLVDSSLV